MESISSDNLPAVWHTLNKIELAIIAHHYFDVDAEVVYGVIAKEIEPLKTAIAYFKEHIDNC